MAIDLHPSTAGRPGRLAGRWLVAARIGWLAISLPAIGLMLLALVANVLTWAGADGTACDAACMADFQAYLRVFGTPAAIGLYYGLGQAVEMVPWLVAGGLIFWRKADEPFALGFSLMLVLAGIFISDGIVQLIVANKFPALMPLRWALETVAHLLLPLFFRFPDGRFAARPLRWAAWAWVMLVLGSNLLPGTWLDFNALPAPLPLAVRGGLGLALAAAMVYRYRRVSGPVERQQIKWLVGSVALVALVYALGLLIWPLRQPGNATVMINLTFLPVYYLSWGLVPCALGMALLRYRLWEIDLIIRKSLLYSSLTVLLALMYGGSVVVLQGVFGRWLTSQNSALVNVGSTLLIAALFGPLRQRVQASLDRRFFRRTYDSAQTLARFAAGARDEVELAQLRTQLEAAVQATVQPQHVALWLKPPSGAARPSQQRRAAIETMMGGLDW